VDSLQKRVAFLEHLISSLELTGIEAIHSRAEDLGQDKAYREKFSIVTSRAVAKMPVLAEFCLPLVEIGGVFLAYKGPEGREELKSSEIAVKLLGGRVKEVIECILPLQDGERKIIVLEKVSATPKEYPRRPGLPGKKPL
jgi:16S rRNA (guanine527-N7)-methyltransferase